MGTTPTYLLPYPELADAADANQAVKPLADRLEVVLPTIAPPATGSVVGPGGSRPPASSVPEGSMFFATDTLGGWVAHSNAWVLATQSRPRISLAQFGAAPFTSPYDLQQVRVIEGSSLSSAQPTLGINGYLDLDYDASIGKWVGREEQAWKLNVDTAQPNQSISGGPFFGIVTTSSVFGNANVWTDLFAYRVWQAAGFKLQVRLLAFMTTNNPGGYANMALATFGMDISLGAPPTPAFGPNTPPNYAVSALSARLGGNGYSGGQSAIQDSGWVDLVPPATPHDLMFLVGAHRNDGGNSTSKAGSTAWRRWTK